MAFRVGVTDHGGTVSAAVFDLPGCQTSASSLDRLVDVLPVAIADHVQWLHRSGIVRQTPERIDPEIVERVVVADSGAADGEFCFADDLRPMVDSELEAGLHVMECSRRCLSSIVEDLPPQVLHWRPPVSAMARVDEWNPVARTITEILQEIAGAEFYYRSALYRESQEAHPDDELHDLSLQRRRLEEDLRALPPEDRGRVFNRTLAWQTAEEHWTARKVLRRVIGHERFHTAEIEQRLAWLKVGVPDFTRHA